MSVKKKLIWITTLIIIAAVAIFLCVECFAKGQITEYEGTLVKKGMEYYIHGEIEFPYLI